jgi:hypothetical protein
MARSLHDLGQPNTALVDQQHLPPPAALLLLSISIVLLGVVGLALSMSRSLMRLRMSQYVQRGQSASGLCQLDKGLLDVDVGLGRGLEEHDAELVCQALPLLCRDDLCGGWACDRADRD